MFESQMPLDHISSSLSSFRFQANRGRSLNWNILSWFSPAWAVLCSEFVGFALICCSFGFCSFSIAKVLRIFSSVVTLHRGLHTTGPLSSCLYSREQLDNLPKV